MSIWKWKKFRMRRKHTRMQRVLAHPECPQAVLELADYIGSTTGIINYAGETDVRRLIICTGEWCPVMSWRNSILKEILLSRHASCMPKYEKSDVGKDSSCLKDGGK